jgi:Family of unknown function (DUF6572)
MIWRGAIVALDQPRTIDAVGINNDSGDAILTIADSWDWEDEHGHLQALQAKLNSYFEFIESGQIMDDYPAARDRRIVIEVVTRFPMTDAGSKLIKRAIEVARPLNLIIRHGIYAPELPDG